MQKLDALQAARRGSEPPPTHRASPSQEAPPIVSGRPVRSAERPHGRMLVAPLGYRTRPHPSGACANRRRFGHHPVASFKLRRRRSWSTPLPPLDLWKARGSAKVDLHRALPSMRRHAPACTSMRQHARSLQQSNANFTRFFQTRTRPFRRVAAPQSQSKRNQALNRGSHTIC